MLVVGSLDGEQLTIKGWETGKMNVKSELSQTR